MNPETLWARCTWVTGTCFRCDRTGLDVTAIGTLEGWGVQAEIHACRACTFHLDQLLWHLVMTGGDRATRPDPPTQQWTV